MPSFSELYAQLNDAQRQAVDTIEGPVMVVAGPGTGKTQLLSMRVANILRRTDTLPSNILCLTFTESGATAMRARLATIIGQDAYKVSIHTFHSFGTEIINHYPEHFYAGARFQPADELSAYEMLEPILADLPHSSPLATTMNSEFTQLRDIQNAISLLKRAGLLPAELLTILDHNIAFMDHAEPVLAKAFDVPRMSAKMLPAFESTLQQLQKFKPAPIGVDLIQPLADICTSQLERALTEAHQAKKTTPLTAWRNAWLERNHANKYVFKDRTRSKKLRDLASVYQSYREHMDEHELFDFDDMIMRAVHAFDTTDELRYNLQEQYLYILVDEFQDTNGAQLRLLHNLTNNPVHEGRPNIMVVGDDDQAIYAFQGAELSNILQFEQLYRQPVVINLTDNYRSANSVLQAARAVVTQGQTRLETTLGINKNPVPHNNHAAADSQLHSFATPTDQYQWVVQHVQQQIQQGKTASEIAIIARNHKQLAELLPHLNQAGVPINYERRSNVLDTPHILALELLARTVSLLGEQRFELANAYLPELLSYEFWGIKTADLWQLSLDAHRSQRIWLEVMLERGGRLQEIAEFLIVASHLSQHQPLETMLDKLIGSEEVQASDGPDDESTATQLIVDAKGLHESVTPADTNSDAQDPSDPQLSLWHVAGKREDFVSPFRAYYFSGERLASQPSEYLAMLSGLRVIRRRLREYHPDQPLLLSDFINFIDLHHKTGIGMVDASQHRDQTSAINLMTAHKSKGLEYDTVIVLSCQDTIWGTSARSRHSSLSFPHNLPIEPAGDTGDDHIRLFFVAMTRARHNLYLTSYRNDDAGKASLLASFLVGEAFTPIQHDAKPPQATAAELQLSPIVSPAAANTDLARNLLEPQLEKYRLSVTHLNNFLDITGGGPQAFLLQNLLRFPQAKSPSAAFGSAVHAALQRAHLHLNNTGEPRPTEDVLHDFELLLQRSNLEDRSFAYLNQKGSDVLQAYLAGRPDHFKPGQKVEYSFGGQDVRLGDVRISGALDLLEIDTNAKTITVTDYKTGKPAASWRGTTEYEKIKLHKYKQQLMFYKLLVENSREFGGRYTVDLGRIEFVEPDKNGKLQRLEMIFEPSELARFNQLISAVWQRIMVLDLPDTSEHEASYKGLLEFEARLLAGEF